MINKLSSN